MHIFLVTTEKNTPRTEQIEKVAAIRGCAMTRLGGLAAALAELKAKPDKSALLIVIGDAELGVPEIESLADTKIPRLNVFYISDHITAEDYKRLLHLGFVDASDWSSAARELDNFISRHAQPGDGQGNRPGFMVSFLGVGGGVGNTTLAMETAIALASSLAGKKAAPKNENVGLLDLNLESSVVCEYLNLQPKLDLAGIAENPSRLDSFMIGMLAARHPSGVDIFASIPAPGERANIPQTSILEFLNCIDEIYPTIILDIPDRPSLETKEIVKASDLVILTAFYNVPSIKLLRKKCDRLRSSGVRPELISIVLTDASTNLIGSIAHRFDAAGLFPDTQILYVRRDRNFAMECVDIGVSMVQTKPQAGISKDIIGIAAFIQERRASR
jgi:pilus assembly protein CpaE